MAAGITISVQDLGKRFNREWIFRKMTHTFTPENVYAITGSNGSGKSTLIQVLTGNIPPSTGALNYYDGVKKIEIDDIFKHISIAAPYVDLIDELTLIEHLTFHFKLKKSRNNVTVEELMSIMYLESARDKSVGNFSSGMKQRLKLAMAFYTEAAILFLDEPGTNLDKKAFDWYLTELSKLPKAGLIFIASNNPSEYPANATVLNIQDFKI